MRFSQVLLLLTGFCCVSIIGCEPLCSPFEPTELKLIEGKGNNEAIPYNPEVLRMHRVVIIHSSSGELHEWNDNLPNEWTSFCMNHIELVLAVDEEKSKHVGSCGPYMEEPKIYANLHMYYITLRLLEAHTGKEVATYELKGSTSCPSWLLCDPFCQKDIYGAHVDVTNAYPEVETFLSKYVPPKS